MHSKLEQQEWSAASEDSAQSAIEVRTLDVEGQLLRVALKRGPTKRVPLLLFNGISANWELAKPFLAELKETEAIIFDVPGVGASPLPKLPYRPATMAKLAAKLVRQLGHDRVDVAGVSWGGALAQEFAHKYPDICRKLVLAATSPGAIAVPGRLSAMAKMATPRRYMDKTYMRRVAGEIYGGALRHDPDLIEPHAKAMAGGSKLSYLFQLLAAAGWTSLPWLWTLRQPTLVLMGKDDPLVPAFNGRILSWLIPNARLELIDDGHMFMVTRAAESARIIETFLADTGGAG
jgi:poly(3-hydroxyalkanoate) depolymerase